MGRRNGQRASVTSPRTRSVDDEGEHERESGHLHAVCPPAVGEHAELSGFTRRRRILAVVRTPWSIAAMGLGVCAAAWVALVVSCGSDAPQSSAATGAGGAGGESASSTSAASTSTGSTTGSGGADGGATCADLPCGTPCPQGNCECDGKGNAVFAADCSACQGKACGEACAGCAGCQCNSLGGCVPPGDPTSGCP
jgi:hypothetical protein